MDVTWIHTSIESDSDMKRPGADGTAMVTDKASDDYLSIERLPVTLRKMQPRIRNGVCNIYRTLCRQVLHPMFLKSPIDAPVSRTLFQNQTLYANEIAKERSKMCSARETLLNKRGSALPHQRPNSAVDVAEGHRMALRAKVGAGVRNNGKFFFFVLFCF